MLHDRVGLDMLLCEVTDIFKVTCRLGFLPCAWNMWAFCDVLVIDLYYHVFCNVQPSTCWGTCFYCSRPTISAMPYFAFLWTCLTAFHCYASESNVTIYMNDMIDRYYVSNEHLNLQSAVFNLKILTNGKEASQPYCLYPCAEYEMYGIVVTHSLFKEEQSTLNVTLFDGTTLDPQHLFYGNHRHSTSIEAAAWKLRPKLFHHLEVQSEAVLSRDINNVNQWIWTVSFYALLLVACILPSCAHWNRATKPLSPKSVQKRGYRRVECSCNILAIFMFKPWLCVSLWVCPLSFWARVLVKFLVLI